MTKHPLLFVALLSLLSVVAALIILHFSPGEQGGQLEGVAITQVSVLEEDGGEECGGGVTQVVVDGGGEAEEGGETDAEGDTLEAEREDGVGLE